MRGGDDTRSYDLFTARHSYVKTRDGSTLCVNLFGSNFSISVSFGNSEMILSGLFIDLC